ncbi:MAG TPA: 5-formyltetrahydrofolate cyclo-ligase [Gemmatimonadales bacterium]|nr:5-formyltetrahydrofolate cyclo-ligase [Gemmatimonadales bacterium]
MVEDDKARLRREGLARRDAETDREEKGRRIQARLSAAPIFGRARTVAAYVSVRSEVPTLPLVEAMLAAKKRVVLPVVAGPDIRLVRLDAVSELAPTELGLLEPGPAVRDRADRRLQPSELDLILVPGVAFDRKGGRIGYGRGYYDRVLARIRSGTPTIGLAFEAQVIDAVPMGPADYHLKHLVTEAKFYTFDRANHPGS